jgi:hypothetical protein
MSLARVFDGSCRARRICGRSKPADGVSRTPQNASDAKRIGRISDVAVGSARNRFGRVHCRCCLPVRKALRRAH